MEEQRWPRYTDVHDFVLVVTTTEQRLRNMMEHAEAVAEIALFTTLDQAKQDPRGEIWVDCFGNTASLEAMVR